MCINAARETCGSRTRYLCLGQFGTHHFLQKNNKECTGGTHDFSVGSHQNFTRWYM